MTYHQGDVHHEKKKKVDGKVEREQHGSAAHHTKSRPIAVVQIK